VSIFSRHSNVLEDYRDFVRSLFSVTDDRAREFIERELVAEARLCAPCLRGELMCGGCLELGQLAPLENRVGRKE
jgi:hypothetical protein